MSIDVVSTHAAPPDRVQALLSEEAFLRDAVDALGARLQEAAVDGTTTRVRMLAPTAGIPALFARFVGREVAVTDVRRWRREDGGWRCDIQVRAQIAGRTVEVVGERRLVPDDDGTRSTVVAEARVDAPLVGRQAEGAVRELVGSVLRREIRLLDERLAGA